MSFTVFTSLPIDALLWHDTTVDVLLPVQVNPSPVYPGRQVHVKLPTVFVQLASALQPPLFVAHSSISALLQFI